ncbi:MAG TPA: FAD-dependent monooxygenase [Burkholderiales bacterium]|nr:FAD-dependent monooxygenase [Burkholderiales bacterium]
MGFDVAIMGGGTVGSSLACALGQARVSVALVEPRPARTLPAAGFDTRVYALNARSRRFLEGLGVWQRLAQERVAPVFDMQVFGDDGGAIEFSALRSRVPELAAIVEEANLLQALRAGLPARDGLHLAAAACAGASWEEGCVRIALSDGGSLEAALAVAADGADSPLRRAAGVSCDVHDYGAQGVVANFRCEKPHRGAACQWFMDGGVLALLPLPGRHVSMVWSVPDAQAAGLLSLPAHELCARVETASGRRFGALEVVGQPVAFPLRRLRARRLVAPRLALTGDTAHNVHPLAGQGLNLGLADAQALADVIAARGMQPDCGAMSLLRRYERRRREELLAMEAVTDGLHVLFGSSAPGARRLRNAGLGLVNRAPALKRLLVKHATG